MFSRIRKSIYQRFHHQQKHHNMHHQHHQHEHHAEADKHHDQLALKQQEKENDMKDETKHQNQTAELSMPLYGVALSWIEDIFKDKGNNSETMVTADLLPIVLDITKDTKVSIAEHLMAEPNSKNKMKPVADYFVSHAWKYKLSDLIDSLNLVRSSTTKYDEDKAIENDIFVWLDILSVNQHVSMTYTSEFWASIFHNGIKSIGTILVVLSPWDAPLSFTRSWCLWEIYGAAVHGVDINMVVSPAQANAFREALRTDSPGLIARLAKIDASKAQAFKDSDREMILAAAKTAPGGVEAVQENIVRLIRYWMTEQSIMIIQQIEQEYEKDPPTKDQIQTLATFYNNTGLLLNQQGEYERQEQFTLRGLELLKLAVGEYHSEVGTGLNNLGSWFKTQGRYPEALDALTQAVDIYRRAVADISVIDSAYLVKKKSLAAAIINKSEVYRATTKFTESETLLREALEILRSISTYDVKDPPNCDEAIALCLSNLGNVLHDQTKEQEALEALNESLHLYKSSVGADHPFVAVNLNITASIYLGLGKYNEAENLYKEALALNRKTYGEDHPDVSLCMNNIAELLRTIGKFKESEPYYVRSIEIDEKTYGESNPSTQISTLNLGLLNMELGNFTEAEKRIQKALNNFNMSLGAEHPNSAVALSCLGLLHETMKQYEESLEENAKAVEVLRKGLGDAHSSTAIALSNYASVLIDVQRYDEAEPIVQEALDLFLNKLGRKHRRTAMCLRLMGQIKQGKGLLIEAETLFKDTVYIYTDIFEVYNKNHYSIATSKFYLGKLLKERGEKENTESIKSESTKYLREALDIRKEVFGDTHPFTKEIESLL